MKTTTKYAIQLNNKEFLYAYTEAHASGWMTTSMEDAFDATLYDTEEDAAKDFEMFKSSPIWKGAIYEEEFLEGVKLERVVEIEISYKIKAV